MSSKLKPAAPQEPPPSRAGLSIRSSLLLGFGALGVTMMLTSAIALFSTNQVSESIGVVLNKQLPEMLETIQVASASEALTSAGAALANVKTDAARQLAFRQVDEAEKLLEQTLNGLPGDTHATDSLRRHTDALRENFRSLRTVVDQRLELQQKLTLGHERLTSNLQTFKQQLDYRTRILEADNDVAALLLSRPSPPPMDRITEIARRSVQWSSVSRFYTEVQTISGQVFDAAQDPSLSALTLSRKILDTEIADAGKTFEKLPPDIRSNLGTAFTDLKEIIQAETGLLSLRRGALTLELESRNLITESQRLTGLVREVTAGLVSSKMNVLNEASQSANEMRRQYTFLLLVVTGLGSLGIVAISYFYVLRHLIFRLTWLSQAMQSVAAGKLDTPLPPAGIDELGRLGSAVHQFQKTAAAAERRELDLRISGQSVEKARAELEQKAQELEMANGKLKELSVTDFLTGLANRRRFDEFLGKEWARAVRAQHSIALIMIDVDQFKKFNDRYGHQAGDLCLQEVASALATNLNRAGDIVARYGGEEFCVISAGADIAGVRTLAEKMRTAVESLGWIHSDSSFGVVTISLGIAVAIPDRTQSADDFVRMADTALYAAKASGRNCIKYYGDT